MQGRYGTDGLNKFLMIASMIIILLSNFIRIRFMYLGGIAMLAYAYFRMMSRNIPKRQRENIWFMKFKGSFSSMFSSNKRGYGNKRQGSYPNNSNGYNNQTNANRQQSPNGQITYLYYDCKVCGQKARVPKGKGMVKVTCPKCGSTFVQKT